MFFMVSSLFPIVFLGTSYHSAKESALGVTLFFSYVLTLLLLLSKGWQWCSIIFWARLESIEKRKKKKTMTMTLPGPWSRMQPFPRGPLAALLPTMLSIALSRTLGQVVAGGKLSPRPFGFVSRAFATSTPESGQDSGNGSNKLLPLPGAWLNMLWLGTLPVGANLYRRNCIRWSTREFLVLRRKLRKHGSEKMRLNYLYTYSEWSLWSYKLVLLCGMLRKYALSGFKCNS